MQGRILWTALMTVAISLGAGCDSSNGDPDRGLPECGDGVVDMDEVCDDGNIVDGDGCSMDCGSDETCGNGVVDLTTAEACDDENTDETDGCLSSCELAVTCGQIQDETAVGVSGIYEIDPDGDAGEAAFDAYCDMTTDGGGWTLLSWNGDGTTGSFSLPYPGLAICSTLDCSRGSAAAGPSVNALFDESVEFGYGHTTSTIASYTDLGMYEYSAKYNYGSLSGLTLNFAPTSCGSGAGADFGTGTYTSLSGPTDLDGTTTYLSNALAYAGYDYALEANSYIWSIGFVSSYCNGNGNAPGTYIGTHFAGSDDGYGPYLASTEGARSIWLR